MTIGGGAGGLGGPPGDKAAGLLPSLKTAVASSWALLSPSAHRRYARVVAGQMATGLLDLIGIALIGLVGVVGTAAVSESEPGAGWIPDIISASSSDPLVAAALIALAAAVILLARSVAYAALLRLNYRLLARSQSEAVRSLFGRFMAQPISAIQERPSQSVAYALSTGATAAVTALLGSLSVVLTDSMLLVLIGVGLFVIDPVTTAVAAAYLACVGVIVHVSLSRWSARNGARLGTTGVGNMVMVQETLGLYRELWAMGRIDAQVTATRDSLEAGIEAKATQTLIEQIPRVVYDAALVVGALLLAVWQLRINSLQDAIVTMLLFLAAASRVLPSLMRVNGQLIQMRSAAAQARPTYALAASLAAEPLPLAADPDGNSAARTEGPPLGVRLADVSFTYLGAERPALSRVTLDVIPGDMVALVGPTGSGKSTLADVMVGLLEPDEGLVLVGDDAPRQLIRLSPGSVAYVPQRVMLIDGTVRQNVAIGLPDEAIDDDAVWEALRRAHVDQVVRELPDGLDSRVGEHGLRLSGGQRQRLGLARALFGHPRLLILDEATSALDAETEREIGAGLRELRGRITVLVIAHRLAGIRSADRIVYLESGEVVAQGTFEELLAESSGFARQVQSLDLQGNLVGEAP